MSHEAVLWANKLRYIFAARDQWNRRTYLNRRRRPNCQLPPSAAELTVDEIVRANKPPVAQAAIYAAYA